jgi:hypothetical protein
MSKTYVNSFISFRFIKPFTIFLLRNTDNLVSKSLCRKLNFNFDFSENKLVLGFNVSEAELLVN